MKIRVEHGDFEESEVVLRCKELDDEMIDVLAILRERLSNLTAYMDGETHILQPEDIYYAEAVDGKTFLYAIDKVLETSNSLAGLEDAHHDVGFFRIGKSQLVNLYRVSTLKSLPNSRIEITLSNNEKLIVSRHYSQRLKEKLGIL